MATARLIVKKRIGPDGVEIVCTEDPAKWVDIKETKKAPYERGRGPAYQKTFYSLEPKSELRTYDDPPKITFKNPDDETQTIEYLRDKGPNHGIIKTIKVEAGRGPYYQATRITYENSEENTTRKVREQKVENEKTGDFLMVERILKYSNAWGRGPAYQGKVVTPANDEENIKASTGPCKVE